MAVAILVAVVIIAKLLAREEVIHVPRSTRPLFPRFNSLGLSIARNECPFCHDLAGFYGGPGKPEYAVLYCGNPQCRAGFRVKNYGKNLVYAEPDEPGPKHLY
jgi:hypothetical protein